MREYLIRLPWPPQGTSPNGSQGKWRDKADAAKAYKLTCGNECMAQAVRPMPAVASVEITFHPPRRGRFDLDNMLARAKQGLDAVAEAIGVDDGDWPEIRLLRGDKAADGCVMVHIKAENTEKSVG